MTTTTQSDPEQNAFAAPARPQPYTPPPTRPSLDDFAHCLSHHLSDLEDLCIPEGSGVSMELEYVPPFGAEYPTVFNEQFWNAVRIGIHGALKRFHPGDDINAVRTRVGLLQHGYSILTPVAGNIMEHYGVLGRYNASMQMSLGTTLRQIEHTLLDTAYLDSPPADWAPDDGPAREALDASPTESRRLLFYAMHHEQRAWERFCSLLRQCFVFSKKGIGSHSYIYFLMDSNLGTTFLMNPPA